MFFDVLTVALCVLWVVSTRFHPRIPPHAPTPAACFWPPRVIGYLCIVIAPRRSLKIRKPALRGPELRGRPPAVRQRSRCSKISRVPARKSPSAREWNIGTRPMRREIEHFWNRQSANPLIFSGALRKEGCQKKRILERGIVFRERVPIIQKCR